MSSDIKDAIVNTLEGEPYKPLDDELINPYWLDLSADIPEPEPVILQGDVNVCTLGNFSCITGQAKSRKTFLITLITGAFLCPDEFMGMSGTSDTGIVLYIDTEQAIPHVQRVVRRIHRIAGFDTKRNNDRLRVLCLRELAPTDRRNAVEVAIRKVKPMICVIDGVADLMEDTNNNQESVSIASLLLRLTTQHNCHILVALHANPNSDRARGHIGSEITRKAETILHITKDGENSVVKAAYCRDIEIQDFAFFVNSEGLPELTEMPAHKPKTAKLDALFSEIIPLPNTMAYADLVEKVKEKASVADRQAKRKIKAAIDEGLLEINKAGYYHLKQKSNDNEPLPF